MPEVARAREVHALMRAGALDGLSIGFRMVKGRRDRASGVRRLERIDLWEISVVTFPLLPEARVAVRAVERGWQNARSVLALEAGELEIATVLSLAVGLLPRHIRVWHERHPNVAIRLHEFRHRVLLEDAVEQGVADFALGPRPVRRWDGPLEVVGLRSAVPR
jgi:hypothetical protein